MKFKNVVYSLLLATFTYLATSCSSESSRKGPMYNLSIIYAEMAQNKQKISEAFQEVYSAPRDQQQALHQKAVTLSEEIKEKNDELVAKAKQEGEQLQGAEIACETSAQLDYKVDKAVFSTVQAQEDLANIVVKVTTQGTPSQKPYFLFVDNTGRVVQKNIGIISGDKISVNFRITTNKGAAVANSYAATEKLVIVTAEEYKKGAVAATGDAPAENADKISASESELEPEPEPSLQ